MKNYILIIVAALLISVGVVIQVQPDVLSSIPYIQYISSVQKPSVAIIFEEGAERQKLPVSQTITLSLASGIGVRVLDLDIVGKNKERSKDLEPYLLAIKDQELPVLVMKWSSGKITTKPCPMTMELLKKEVQ